MDGGHDEDNGFSVQVIQHKKLVTAGGRRDYGDPQRLSATGHSAFPWKGTIEIHAGDTVEWSNVTLDGAAAYNHVRYGASA